MLVTVRYCHLFIIIALAVCYLTCLYLLQGETNWRVKREFWLDGFRSVVYQEWKAKKEPTMTDTIRSTIDTHLFSMLIGNCTPRVRAPRLSTLGFRKKMNWHSSSFPPLSATSFLAASEAGNSQQQALSRSSDTSGSIVARLERVTIVNFHGWSQFYAIWPLKAFKSMASDASVTIESIIQPVARKFCKLNSLFLYTKNRHFCFVHFSLRMFIKMTASCWNLIAMLLDGGYGNDCVDG